MQPRAIIQAIKENTLDDLENLLLSVEEKELKIDETDKHDRTALIHAAEKGYIQVVSALLAHGADINAADSNGMTALMYAAERGDMNMVDLLLNVGGVDIDTINKYGESALSLATNEAHLEVVDKLLVYGAKSCSDDLPEITFKATHQDDCFDETATMPKLSTLLLRGRANKPKDTPENMKAEQLIKDRADIFRELRSLLCAPYQSFHGLFSKSANCDTSEEKKALSNCLHLIPTPKTVPQLQQVQILLPEIVKIIEEYLSFNPSSKFTKRLK